jgi:hypothetical protein
MELYSPSDEFSQSDFAKTFQKLIATIGRPGNSNTKYLARRNRNQSSKAYFTVKTRSSQRSEEFLDQELFTPRPQRLAVSSLLVGSRAVCLVAQKNIGLELMVKQTMNAAAQD